MAKLSKIIRHNALIGAKPAIMILYTNPRGASNPIRVLSRFNEITCCPSNPKSMPAIQKLKTEMFPLTIKIIRSFKQTKRMLLSSILSMAVPSLALALVVPQNAPSTRDYAPHAATGLTATNVENGWISLFDGKTLFGWKPEANTNTDWHVKDGAIQANHGDMSLLRTTAQFDDFELKLEFKCSSKTNSGVFLRTSPKPKNPSTDCYEINIADTTNPFPTGSIVGRKEAKLANPSSQWNLLHATAQANRIKVSINGVNVLDYIDDQPLGKGYIGLQFNSGMVAFRNIHLKPLDLTPLIDEEFTYWNRDQQLESQFTIKREKPLVMNVKGGKGQIETKKTFADFVFQLDCKTQSDGLNSGVFFRCIPGDLMNGYESQIQNQYKDGQRDKPVDCGTGGIFRRSPARRVISDDLAWFSKTIVATGPHVSVWVNGYQVTDWSDQRKPDPNPRKGRRLKAGTFILQGHDPTTNIDFRKIKVREISERRPQQIP